MFLVKIMKLVSHVSKNSHAKDPFKTTEPFKIICAGFRSLSWDNDKYSLFIVKVTYKFSWVTSQTHYGRFVGRIQNTSLSVP